MGSAGKGKATRVAGVALAATLLATVIGWVGATAPAGADPAVVAPAKVAVGQSHACALTPSSGVRCWGSNAFGQLGNGTTTSSTAPVDVIGLTSNVAWVVAGSNHTCAATAAGALWCWGGNTTGQLGDGTTTTSLVPVAVVGMDRGVLSATAGSSHTCAIAAGGAVWCWGNDASGQVGNGPGGSSSVPVALPALSSGIRSLDAGFTHTCAVTPAGGARCWGENSSGESGTLASFADRPEPAAVDGLTDSLVSIDAGGSHTCGITTSADVVCWGQGAWGQIVPGATSWNAPTLVPGATGAVELGVGWLHTCARLFTGSIVCWGANESNETGLERLRRQSPVTPVPGISDSVDLAAGRQSMCSLRSDGVLSCWGLNTSGQLGNGTTVDITSPRPVAGSMPSVSGLSFRNQHACAATTTGAVWCWGSNTYGRLGVGEGGQSVYGGASSPTASPDLTGDVAEVGAGQDHSCARSTGGAVACWGATGVGQVGDGTADGSTSRLHPTPVTGLSSGATALAVGANHSCAITTPGALVCWGSNGLGQLGIGTNTKSTVPVGVTGMSSGVAAVAAGATSTCAITTAGALRCWGKNDVGQLGDGTTTSSTVPVDVVGLTSGVTAVAIGTSHACAIANGGVWCWGLGWDGRLGNGAMATSSVPVPVTGITGATAVGAGEDHSCAIAAGALTCWGKDEVGQLGDGTTTSSSVPVAVVGLSFGVTDVAVSARATCANRSGAGIRCWGHDEAGRLGQGAVHRYAGGPLVSTEEDPWAPFASWSALVDQVYVDLTGTVPSSAERATWVTQLAAGTKTKGDLAAALRVSDDNLTNVDATARLYRAFLGRAPDRGGLVFWIGRRRSGSWKLVRMADQFAASSEFKRKYGTLSNRAFVTLIYTDVMGRPADPGGVEYWTGQLDTKKKTRGGVMVGFSESSEYKRKQAVNTDVAVAHILLLQRAASAAETADWVTLTAAGAAHRSLLLEVLDRPDYAIRFAG